MAHVVSAVLGASGPLLLKLTDLIGGKYGRLKGVRKQIHALRLELSVMHAAVRKYTMLEDPDIQVKQWISMVRELAYDIEDKIDKFIHRLGNGGRHGGFKESFRRSAHSLKTLGARNWIANQIDELQARIKHVKELKNSYKLDDANCSTSNHIGADPRLSALFAEDAHLVGIDGPRDDLVKWMIEEGNNSSKHPKVLSIVGFGGLGKTTLANKVYLKIEEHFHCRAVVSVSQKPDIKKIIKDVILKVPYPHGFTEDIGIWDEVTSIAKLRMLLQNKRYLIIIDDIWSTPAWDAIKCAFPENNYSSRIIVTTRNIDVARSCSTGGDDRMYEMKALSDLHSQCLFFRRIFGSEDRCPDTLKEVSNQILKKCGGLPLAIICISGLLSNKPAIKDEWEKVKKSIGSAMEDNLSLEGMNSILCLSYNDLSLDLRTCFLYLCVFPEDYVIERERLVRRWIAEGFISEQRGPSQYEVAERYFYELINKSMVQPVHTASDDGRVYACRVHDMMLEIIIKKSVEQNFVTVVGRGQTSILNPHGIIRRLSIQHIDNELALALANEDLSHLRSLTVTAPDCARHLPGLIEFEALRVLDLEGCEGLERYDMNSMHKLFKLRYLGLKGTGISKLPSRMVMLSDLETLDFRDTSVQELPTGFIKLTKLQYLLAGSQTKMPIGIGVMNNLRVISPFNASMSPSDALEELGDLTRLNELYVYLDCGGPDACKTHEEKLFSSLGKLTELRSLNIHSDDGHFLEFFEPWTPMPSGLQRFSMSTRSYFRNVPKWIAPALASLTSLDINLSELTEDGLHTLGELPALLTLTLWLEKGEYMITVQGTGFPSLKIIEIYNCKGTYITFVKGATPKLEALILELSLSVGRNHGFQLGIVHLPCLKMLVAYVRKEGGTSFEEDRAAAVDVIMEEKKAHKSHPKVYFSTREYEDKGCIDDETMRAVQRLSAN